jgi:malate dehydrogenase
MLQNKISIIGAGMTGSTAAHWLAQLEIADIVLVDILEGMPQGKSLDLLQSMPIIGVDVTITGSNNYQATENSDIVIITAGLPRKPGMSRDDLLMANTEIISKVAIETKKMSPEAIFIVLTNPLDVMAYVAMMSGSISPKRIIGQAGILDSTRMRTFVAQELGVSVKNVHCYVLGGHGDDMVPLTGISNVAGVPLKDVMPTDRLEAIVKRTRQGGGEIVSLLKKGSAYYAPAAALSQMTEAILKDKNLIVPASVFMNGQYGLKDIFFGVPVQLGRNGVEEIIEYKLSDDELAALNKSAAGIEENISKLDLQLTKSWK